MAVLSALSNFVGQLITSALSAIGDGCGGWAVMKVRRSRWHDSGASELHHRFQCHRPREPNPGLILEAVVFEPIGSSTIIDQTAAGTVMLRVE